MNRYVVPAVVLLVAVACDAGADGTGGDGQGEAASFVAADIDFEQAPDRLDAGEVTVELVNDGALPHNVTFEGVGDAPVVEAGPGETATGSVTLDPGEYVVYCGVSGHRDAGMEVGVVVDG